MCRLYGFISNEATKVECSLAYAQNAIMHQSRQDSAGIAHPDGWGIAWYEDGLPRVERSIKSAYEDLWFSTTAEKVYAQTIIAHVRRASVGKVRIEN